MGIMLGRKRYTFPNSFRGTCGDGRARAAGWETGQPTQTPTPTPQSCPYLPIDSYRRLILFRLPVTIEAQVIVVMQLGLREPGFPGTVREAFHHLLQRKQPGYKKCFLLKDSAHARY